MISDLATVKEHLKVSATDTSEDTVITIYMEAAQVYIEAFIDGVVPGSTDSPPEEADGAFKGAFLLLVAGSYENREAEGVVEIKENKAVDRLLWPKRQQVGV